MTRCKEFSFKKKKKLLCLKLLSWVAKPLNLFYLKKKKKKKIAPIPFVPSGRIKIFRTEFAN